MFDDRLFDVIMSEMMDAFGPEVRTDEGSLAYNACCKIALKLEEVYGDMNDINDNMVIDTMDLNHMIPYAVERGLVYKEATAPIAKGVFQQEIEIGERFSCNDYIYAVTALIEDYTYELTCETSGTEANTNLGELEPVDYIEDYQGGEITEVITVGTDDEDEEVFRARIIESFSNTSFGGNRLDYKNKVDSITGIGGCKPKRRESDSEYVDVYVVSTSYGVPDDTVIDNAQTIMDPTENSGEGVGLAPICHKVDIKSAVACSLDITCAVELEAGFTLDSVEGTIKSTLQSYFESLRKAWEENDLNYTRVRSSQMISAVLEIDGIADVSYLYIFESGTTDPAYQTYLADWNAIPILVTVSIAEVSSTSTIIKPSVTINKSNKTI